MPKSQITVEAVENKAVSGSKADYAALKLLFPGSPLYTDYTKEYLDANKNGWLTDGKIDDGGYGMLGSVQRDYHLYEGPHGPPSYEEVNEAVKGVGKGMPASAFVPNPISPGEGEVAPEFQTAAPDGYGQTNPYSRGQFGTGAGTGLSPADSSQQIAGQVIGQLPSKRSSNAG